ncbi:hypothetical protein SBADM41S_02462 [Streptomyces badius]
MARARPNVPEVVSTISVRGPICPLFTAVRRMCRARTSFIRVNTAP